MEKTAEIICDLQGKLDASYRRHDYTLGLLKKAEAELEAARPLLEAAAMPDTMVKRFAGTQDVRLARLLKAALAYRESQKPKERA